MIVAHYNGVDRWNVLDLHPRFSPTTGTDPEQRTCSFRPNWIRQEIEAGALNKHSRVIHESNPDLSAFHLAGRYGLVDVRNEIWRWFGGAQLPSKSV
jgi:coproporphyrinogen III oxidase